MIGSRILEETLEVLHLVDTLNADSESASADDVWLSWDSGYEDYMDPNPGHKTIFLARALENTLGRKVCRYSEDIE